MADLKTNLKISGDSLEAQQAVADLDEKLKSAKGSTEETSNALDGMGDSAKSSGKDVEDLTKDVEDLASQKDSIDELAAALDRFEREAKKLGRDFSTLVTAPIAALAGISLKNLYDTGSIEGASGSARNFALVMQDLMRTFKELSLELGQKLAPILSNFANSLKNLMTWFRSLDESTKDMIINFGLIAAAIGPVILAVSSIVGLFVKLVPVFKVAAAAFSAFIALLKTPVVLIASLAVSVAGLINVFIKLKQAGVETGQALKSTFDLFITGFNNYVTKNLLKGINLILKGMSSLAGFTGLSTAGIDAAASYVDGLTSELEKSFAGATGRIDSQLESIGSSAAEAFTFGWSNIIPDFSGMFSAEKMGGKLESEMGKTFDSAFKKVELAQQNHILAMEQAEFEHQQKMLEITDSMDPAERLNSRLVAEEEFLMRRQELEREALFQRVEEERKALEAIQDLNERARQERELNEKTALEVTQLNNQQELEMTRLHNEQVQQLAAERYEKLKGYANDFASGLSNAFVEVADGTKSLGQALEDFTKQFVRNITQMILQAMIYKSIMGSIPGFASGGPVGGPTPALATGGYIRGPGTGTSDSIMARLSNGEFVNDAKTVAHFGVDFFHNLKRMARGGVPISPRGSVPGFADGGLVSSSSQAPQVVIENRGTPSQVVGTEYDPKSAVITVIIDDLSKNGPASKAIQSTFGVKRGGFR